MAQGDKSDQAGICLIGGSGRSGTTILKKIFQNHPDVAHIPEWRFSIDPDGLVDFYNTFSTGWSPFLFDSKLKRLERLLRRISKSERPSRLVGAWLRLENLFLKNPRKWTPPYRGDFETARYCPDYPQCLEALIEALVDFRYGGIWVGMAMGESDIHFREPFDRKALARILGAFFRAVVQSALRAQEASFYVEDNTWNILWFDKLRQLLPEAKLVHIHRHPFDVVASYVKQSWAPSDPLSGAKFYKAIMERWWKVREGLPADSFREISLADLVADPKQILLPVCDFWGMEWHEKLLETDLSRSHAGRWRSDLTQREQTGVAEILGNIPAALGYHEDG